MLGPHHAAALAARPVAGPGVDPAEGDTEQYDLGHQLLPPLVVRAASALLARLDTPPVPPTLLNADRAGLHQGCP